VKKPPHLGVFVLCFTEIHEGVYFDTLSADGLILTKRLTVKR
jgi:hypothetical protein